MLASSSSCCAPRRPASAADQRARTGCGPCSASGFRSLKTPQHVVVVRRKPHEAEKSRYTAWVPSGARLLATGKQCECPPFKGIAERPSHLPVCHEAVERSLSSHSAASRCNGLAARWTKRTCKHILQRQPQQNFACRPHRPSRSVAPPKAVVRCATDDGRRCSRAVAAWRGEVTSGENLPFRCD